MMRMIASVLLISAATTTSCSTCDDDERSPASRLEPSIRAPSVTILDVSQHPEHYDGHTVRLVGEILERRGDRIFVIRGRGVLWASTITVLAATPDAVGPLVGDKNEVEIRGTVRAHTTPEQQPFLQRELDPGELAALGAGPYVIASSIEGQR